MESQSRRSFIRQGACITAAGALGSALLPASVAGEGGGYPTPAISPAVTDFVLDEYGAVYADAAPVGALTADQLDRVASATDLLFRSFEETGFNGAAQGLLQAQSPAVVAYTPGAAELASIQATLQAHKINISQSLLIAGFGDESGRAAAIPGLLHDGLWATESQVATTLRAKASELRGNGPMSRNSVLCGGLEAIAALLAVGCAFATIPFCIAAAVVAILIFLLDVADIC